MPVKDHTAYVPYAVLARAFEESDGWTCVCCGGPVEFLGFGHQPQPRRPLFACRQCGRRSDGCQTFEGHHLLYGVCALEDGNTSRCGYWQGEWARARGVCPVCGAVRLVGPAMATARG